MSEFRRLRNLLDIERSWAKERNDPDESTCQYGLDLLDAVSKLEYVSTAADALAKCREIARMLR